MTTAQTGPIRSVFSERARDRLTYQLLVTIVFVPCLCVAGMERLSAEGKRANARDGRRQSVLDAARSHAHAAVGYAFQP